MTEDEPSVWVGTHGENPSFYTAEDGESYCTEYGHDAVPLDARYGCRYCPPEEY
jgi:hypothetical protein